MAIYAYALLVSILIAICNSTVINPPGLIPQRSAFSAKLVNDMNGGSVNQPIVFGNVLNNVNNDYNEANGKFTVTIPGTYVFSYSLMSKATSSKYAFGCLQKNDLEQTCVWSAGNNANEMSSNTVILDLAAGDVVNVVLKAGSNYQLHATSGAGYCSFSGFLLYPNLSEMKQLADVLTTLTN